jgi:hypothetical protein
MRFERPPWTLRGHLPSFGPVSTRVQETSLFAGNEDNRPSGGPFRTSAAGVHPVSRLEALRCAAACEAAGEVVATPSRYASVCLGSGRRRTKENEDKDLDQD